MSAPVSWADDVLTAAAELRAAADAVDGVRTYKDPAAPVTPPAVIVGPPQLRWEAMSPAPSSATFIVYLMVPMDARALDNLLGLVPLVTAALDALPDAAVTSANPGVFNAGGADLPSYEITVEVSL